VLQHCRLVLPPAMATATWLGATLSTCRLWAITVVPPKTMLPEAGSPVICAGKSGTPWAETVSGTALTTDQRGMPLDSSCSAGETDAGAVQGNAFCKTANTNPNPNPAVFAATQDFNGDCKSDILWRNSSTQQVYEWLMNGTTFASTGSPGTPTSDWVIQGTGDFNGDGKSDILWRNSTTGQVFIWLMNGSTLTSSGSLGYVSSDWTIAGTGDFTGNGKADILWWNSTTGQVYLWFINGTTMSGGGSVSYVSGGWNIAGIGDFNGDGEADILWRNSSTGAALYLADEREHSDQQRRPRLCHVGLGHCGRRRFQWRRQERHPVAELHQRAGLPLVHERGQPCEQRERQLRLAGLEHRGCRRLRRQRSRPASCGATARRSRFTSGS